MRMKNYTLFSPMVGTVAYGIRHIKVMCSALAVALILPLVSHLFPPSWFAATKKKIKILP